MLAHITAIWLDELLEIELVLLKSILGLDETMELASV